MTPAQEFVAHFYDTFEGRVPFAAGYSKDFFGKVYPVVFENAEGVPIGLMAVAANNENDTSQVQLFLISAFRPGQGHGKQIMEYICERADELGVKIYLQAEVQFMDRETPMEGDLVRWYQQFGFVGSRIMTREPGAYNAVPQ